MKPINQNTRIESIKPLTPPSSGDLYEHPSLGVIILLSRSGGNAWWAAKLSDPSHRNRFEVRPDKLKRHWESD